MKASLFATSFIERHFERNDNYSAAVIPSSDDLLLVHVSRLPTAACAAELDHAEVASDAPEAHHQEVRYERETLKLVSCSCGVPKQYKLSCVHVLKAMSVVKPKNSVIVKEHIGDRWLITAVVPDTFVPPRAELLELDQHIQLQQSADSEERLNEHIDRLRELTDRKISSYLAIVRERPSLMQAFSKSMDSIGEWLDFEADGNSNTLVVVCEKSEYMKGVIVDPAAKTSSKRKRRVLNAGQKELNESMK